MYTPGVPGYDKSLPLFMQSGRERAHIGTREYRHAVRPTVLSGREYRLRAYLIDSSAPAVETEVDLDDANKCTIGKCDDPSNLYEKHIAFVVDSRGYQDFIAPGVSRNYYNVLKLHMTFGVAYYNSLAGSRNRFDGGYAIIGREQNVWTGSTYTWNTRPANPGSFSSTVCIGGALSPTWSISDEWNSAGDGATVMYNNLLESSTYNGYGFRLYPSVFTADPEDTGYIELTARLLRWEFLCE